MQTYKPFLISIHIYIFSSQHVLLIYLCMFWTLKCNLEKNSVLHFLWSYQHLYGSKDISSSISNLLKKSCHASGDKIEDKIKSSFYLQKKKYILEHKKLCFRSIWHWNLSQFVYYIWLRSTDSILSQISI